MTPWLDLVLLLVFTLVVVDVLGCGNWISVQFSRATARIYFLEVIMSKRAKVSRRGSKKLFRRSAMAVHHKNGLNGVVMRGGIRL